MAIHEGANTRPPRDGRGDGKRRQTRVQGNHSRQCAQENDGLANREHVCDAEALIRRDGWEETRVSVRHMPRAQVCPPGRHEWSPVRSSKTLTSISFMYSSVSAPYSSRSVA